MAQGSIPGFLLLGESVYLKAGMDDFALEPSPSSASGPSFSYASSTSLSAAQQRSDAPDLIILTSWTGALAKHISKYTTTYSQLFPHTPLLLITTTIADLTLRTTKHKLATLSPAVSYLRTVVASLDLNGLSPRLLLHAFSDGGSHKAVCLARAFLQSTGAPLPLAATVLDSTPGIPRYGASVDAFARSVPAPPALGRPLGAAVLGATWVFVRTFAGRENNVIESTRRALNDPALWGAGAGGGARTYVFSEADDVVAWRDVEAHAQQSAEELGLESLVVRFRDTGHCNHARGNEEFYWRAVLRTWEVGRRDGTGWSG